MESRRPSKPCSWVSITHSRSNYKCGCSSVVEPFVANEAVVSSNLITRSIIDMYMKSYVDFTPFLNIALYDPQSDHTALLPAAGADDYIGCFGREIFTCPVDEFLELLLSTKRYLGSESSYTILLDITAEHLFHGKLGLFNSQNIHIKFIPYWLVWTHYAHEFLYHPSRHTSIQSDKFLYLPGKLNKYWRIAVLQTMAKQNWFSADIASWSLLMPTDSGSYKSETQHVIQSHWQGIPGYLHHTDDFTQFNQNLDYNLDLHRTADNFHLTGVPYDVRIYEQIGFTIISETGCRVDQHCYLDELNFITEKTYRSMYNCLPFIQVCEINNSLAKLGFNTFNRYTKVDNIIDSHYDAESTHQRLVTAVTNMKSAMHHQFEQVQQDAIYNKKLMISISQELASEYDGSLIDSMTFPVWLLKRSSYHNCHPGKSGDNDYDFVFNG